MITETQFFTSFIAGLPTLLAVLVLILRTEHRITRLETIIRLCPNCPPQKDTPHSSQSWDGMGDQGRD